MVRIRRKFAFILCGVTVFFFLILYVVLNYSVSERTRVQDITFLESKIKQLESGLNKHHQEFGDIRKQIDTIRGAVDGGGGDDTYVDSKVLDKAPLLGDREMMKESVINANGGGAGTCALRTDIIPQPDVQMLNLYDQVSFENIDGGVWKQGWPIKYHPSEWNSHHKLHVFVVPHSHNDPGWIQTFDEYYERSTKNIFANMLRHLDENPGLRFIWAEISYFAQWYDKLAAEQKAIVKRLVKNRQLEFVTGGWVMSDEANSHWYSMLLQLTEGQTWLKTRLNVTPVSSWSIDPFGQSATMPYILKHSGFENLLIQRTHYIVKKNLALKKQLEFRWRQLWDTRGDTDLFTHMMPFYSYDVPHTCGPDPKICCQFDFKRLPGMGLTCPWNVPPRPINDQNVAERAEMIVDQWRKKSVLYRTRNVLIPLGDDFRYTTSSEWEAQQVNFERLFDYINNEPSLNVEAKFATLQDYFDAVRATSGVNGMEQFPSLTGDFFTYADVNQDYWSGYFTSRPYHKRQDRILLHYIRSAEMLHAWNVWEPASEWKPLADRLEYARRQLSLFQHHDGITGTAKDHVMEDYAQRMSRSIENCKFVMQQAVYRMLTKPSVYHPDPSFSYLSIDDSRTVNGSDSVRPTIILGDELPSKQVVLHNSLPHTRSEVVEFYVVSPFVTVQDGSGGTVPSQIAPVWSWHTRPDGISQPQPSNTKYRLLFRANVPPLGLSVYTINSKNSAEESLGVTFTKAIILSKSPFTVNLAAGYPEDIDHASPMEVSLRSEEGGTTSAAFTAKGLLKSLTIENNQAMVPVHLEFYRYGMQLSSGKSGAYLFHPAGNATLLTYEQPIVLVMKGLLETSITAGLPFAVHQTILRDDSVEIRNLVDIGHRDNTEIVMRLQTNINSGSTFYTDLNGMQLIKRKRFQKLPIQANYYPAPSTMFIEDDYYRLTLLGGQPLGGSSLSSGEMEIMQDRRLTRDDDRGLGQGVQDNLPVLHLFRLVLESRESCTKPDPDYPTGYLTLPAHSQLQSLLHPLDKLIYNENYWTGLQKEGFGVRHEPLERGIELVAMRELPHVHFGRTSAGASPPVGLIVHRTNFEDCGSEANMEGMLNIKKLLNLDDGHDIYSARLTLLNALEMVQSDDISLCPMDAKAYIVKR
ncbi:alpha-mannosidase 2 [Anopheles stephensi]|uniref:alpha-mannosidase 2 n=1 Tax=Anopheles stephensi TaxID=30069 RepID=UPI0016587A75|nr:alpha-mannosidase 2 [Anopheles stephensi]XP_035892641.1 alpha-mannosidase 2 [Anopheles stephensi]